MICFLLTSLKPCEVMHVRSFGWLYGLECYSREMFETLDMAIGNVSPINLCTCFACGPVRTHVANLDPLPLQMLLDQHPVEES